MRINQYFQTSGFTLTEIIVTMGIIAIIVTLGLINFKALGNSSSTYSSSRDLFVSDVRLAASKALNRERYQGQEPTGWGINFFELGSSYTVFADLNGDRQFNSNETFKNVVLNKDIKMSWLQPSPTYTYYPTTVFTNYATSPAYATSAIVFNTGDGRTYINGWPMPLTPTAHLNISFRNISNALVKIFTITPFGTISY